MRILSWNYHGLGNTPTVRHLQGIHGQYSPEIIFLSETKSRRFYMESIVEMLGFHDPYFSGRQREEWRPCGDVEEFM